MEGGMNEWMDDLMHASLDEVLADGGMREQSYNDMSDTHYK